MSRAMNLNVTEAEVVDACTQHGVLTTAVEALLPMGTRVVCRTSEGAALLRKKLKTKIIDGTVKRSPRFVAASSLR